MDYEAKKARIVREFKALLASGQPVRLGKNTSNLFRARETAQQFLDVRDLNRVISVNENNLTADVEGMTTFDDFTKATLKYGLLPAVVPELKSITIGGAMTGGAIESSSFKHGLVHETVLAMEVLTGTGDIMYATRTNEHKQLFFGFPNTYGTLGYALKLTVKLVRAKKYVKIQHEQFTDAKTYFKAVESACKDKTNDFVDGTVFSASELYLTTGIFTDEAPFVSSYTYMKIYYKSLRQKKVDYLTAYDYIWRWDTDWFWCSKNFGVQRPVLRAVSGPLLKSTMYWKIMRWNRKYKLAEKVKKLTGSTVETESVIQDVQIPIQHCAAFLAFFHKQIGITPVWICPTNPVNKDRYPTYDLEPGQLYVNFGFWDVVPLPQGKTDGFFNRQVEQMVDKLDGRKGLYSTVFYDEKTFWEHYNGKNYAALKKKYDPQNKLRGLYEKTVLRK
jgi:FAD/FMN-containing dehydrogenase